MINGDNVLYATVSVASSGPNDPRAPVPASPNLLKPKATVLITPATTRPDLENLVKMAASGANTPVTPTTDAAIAKKTDLNNENLAMPLAKPATNLLKERPTSRMVNQSFPSELLISKILLAVLASLNVFNMSPANPRPDAPALNDPTTPTNLLQLSANLSTKPAPLCNKTNVVAIPTAAFFITGGISLTA